MKPRIRFEEHVWSCVSYVYDCGWPYVEAVGYGYTPTESYKEWEQYKDSSRVAIFGGTARPACVVVQIGEDKA